MLTSLLWLIEPCLRGGVDIFFGHISRDEFSLRVPTALFIMFLHFQFRLLMDRRGFAADAFNLWLIFAVEAAAVTVRRFLDPCWKDGARQDRHGQFESIVQL